MSTKIDQFAGFRLIATLADLSRYSIPAEAVIRHRAAALVEQFDGDHDKSLAAAVDYFTEEYTRLYPYAVQEMRWSDIQAVATRLPDARIAPIEGDRLWTSVDIEMVSSDGKVASTDVISPRTLAQMLSAVCETT